MFLKLTSMGDEEIYVNTEVISTLRTYPELDDNGRDVTMIYFIGCPDDHMFVKETAKEIFEQMEQKKRFARQETACVENQLRHIADILDVMRASKRR